MHSKERWAGNLPWAERIAGTWTEDFLRIYDSTKWTSDTDETYKNIVDTLYEVLHAEEVHIHLLDAEANIFSRRASRSKRKEEAVLKNYPEYKERATWNVGLGRSKLLMIDRKPQILDFANPHADDCLPYDEDRFAICFPLDTFDEVLGLCAVTYYEHKEWDERDMDYFSIIGFIIGSAIYRLRVADKVRELSILNERKRLGSEIHDNVVQLIHAVSLNAAAAIAAWEEGDLESMAGDLERLEQNCKRTVKVFRDEMLSLRASRACERVTGLIESIKDILDNFERSWAIETRLVVNTLNKPLFTSTISALQLTRILNEALSNTLRHSGASAVTVTIEEDNSHLVMTIADNGSGFDVNRVLPGHWGLKIMRERADEIMGKLDIRSGDAGTMIIIDVPRHR